MSAWDGFVRTQQPRFFLDDQQKQRRSKALKADTFPLISQPNITLNHTYASIDKRATVAIKKNIGLQAFFSK